MNVLTWSLIYLAVPLTYVLADVQLIESGPGLVKPGENLKLTCSVTFSRAEAKFDDYGWSWIRQPPGKGLEWLGTTAVNIFSEDRERITGYVPSLQERMTISADSSQKQLHLQLSSLAAADTAVYYCAGEGNWSLDYWGSGTMVTVSPVTATAPSVFPLVACSEDASAASQVDVACFVSGYFPEPVTVQWNSGAITSGINNFPAVLFSSNSLYSSSSQLTIPADRWGSEKFQCNVAHGATHTRINKNIEPCPTKSPVAPVVHLLHSSCDSRSRDAEIELVCFIRNFFPKDVKVEWLVGGKSGLLPSHTETPRQDATGYTFSTTSSVNVSQADWLEGNTYHCQVTHAATQTVVKSRAKRCEGDSGCQSSGISASITEPTPKDLYVNRAPMIVCELSNLDSEDGVNFRWSREKAGSLNPQPREVHEELDGTFTAISKLPVPFDEWMSGERFTCTAEHASLPGPITKSAARVTGKPLKIPKVFLYPPHHEDLTSVSQAIRKRSAPPGKLTLTCLVKSFTPKAISVQWLLNDNAVPEDQYINTPVMKDIENDTYFMYSMLSVSYDTWNDGSRITCMVVHEGFPAKISQRTVEKGSGKK